MEKVSVVIPVYKTEKYLRECLDSVLSQSLNEIEIICINDGSPDNSLAILKEYEKKDKRIKIIDKKNEGVGKARNDGINMAIGEFVAFMDSDDYYPDDHVLKKLYDAAIDHQVLVSGGYHQSVEENGEIVERSHDDDRNVTQLKGIYQYSDYQYDFGYTCHIYNRKMIIDQHIDFPPYGRFQDPPFFVKAMITAGEAYAINEPTYCYRSMPNEGKCTLSKTMDMLLGIMDNLKISREHELPILHYRTALRLDQDASYMGIQNLFAQDNKDLFSRFIKAVACVDTEWLKSEGYALPEPFLPEFFTYTLELAEKYEKIRQKPGVQMMAGLKAKLRK